MGPGLRKQDRASTILGSGGPAAFAAIGSRAEPVDARAQPPDIRALRQERTNARPFVIP